MPTLAYILLFTFLASIGALVGGFFLLARIRFALKVSHFLAAFAAGVLLASAFFDLLPEALHEGEAMGINVFFWTLMGMLLFFAIERFIHWFHHHEEYHEHEKEAQATIPLIIIGDTAHNFVDGIVIAATFLVDIQLGIVTTLAVAAHEIPQEVADFGLMLHKGLSIIKVILVNIMSASAAFLGALITYAFGNSLQAYLPAILATTAGFFIYIAASDLIPEIHYEKRRGVALAKTALLFLGVAVIWLSLSFLKEGA
ncbi:MAG: ZIP family metal transporter [Candidatus Wildermuthbacteria bacterium]|nr:ZIP family metal transporter [Candidatus Wildermuthbacteria bacterium]